MSRGDSRAADELVPLVYSELRQLAAQKMAREAPGQTLQPTALVHEAWLRLGGDAQPLWESRAHFFGAAAEAMRRILVESVRRKQRLKHGGHLERVEFDSIQIPLPIADDALIALDDALDKLAKVDTRAAEVVKLCYFVGLTHPQTAQELALSLSTVERLWSFARVWLFEEMNETRQGAE